MDDMWSFDGQMPSVGIFWYDPDGHNLFGERKKELTLREVEEAAEKGKPAPYSEFVYDERWDLGHGWSVDMSTSRQPLP